MLTLQEIEHQIALADFAPSLRVTARIEGADVRLIAMQADAGAARGLEILVTAGAIKMYGEGPSISMALTQLAKAAAAGLPEVSAGQVAEQVLLGD